MNRSVIAALGAVVIVTLGASSAAEAGTIDFGVLALSDSIIYSGTSLEVSTALDLDLAIFLVTSARSLRLHGQPFRCYLSGEHRDHLWARDRTGAAWG
jgi:hypothetical protein